MRCKSRGSRAQRAEDLRRDTIVRDLGQDVRVEHPGQDVKAENLGPSNKRTMDSRPDVRAGNLEGDDKEVGELAAQARKGA